jgi:DNA-binding NarL/FixJ family response regulator
MSPSHRPDRIRIGVASEEPIRLAGLSSVFDQPGREEHAQLVPVPGSMRELLAKPELKYLVVDLHSIVSGVKALEMIRRARPDVRMIVIGPADDEELVMKSIIAGARAYLDLNAGPEIVRDAVEVVTQGSIWAPRRLLSKLIDRLLNNPETSGCKTDSARAPGAGADSEGAFKQGDRAATWNRGAHGTCPFGAADAQGRCR